MPAHPYKSAVEVLGEELAAEVAEALIAGGYSNKVTFRTGWEAHTITERRLGFELVRRVRATLTDTVTLCFNLRRKRRKT